MPSEIAWQGNTNSISKQGERWKPNPQNVRTSDRSIMDQAEVQEKVVGYTYMKILE